MVDYCDTVVKAMVLVTVNEGGGKKECWVGSRVGNLTCYSCGLCRVCR